MHKKIINCINIYVILIIISGCTKESDTSSNIFNEKYAVIQKIITIDTILSTGVKFFPESGVDRLPFTIEGDNVWLCNKIQENKIFFKVYNLLNFSSKEFIAEFPSDSNQSYTTSLDAFSLNSRYCVLLFHHILKVFDMTDNTLNFKYSIDLKEPFQYVFLNDTIITLGRAYNHHPKSTPIPVQIVHFNINQQKIQSSFQPNFKGIEFSHFFPYHWIDAAPNGKSLLLSQTIEYRIDIYNEKFQNIGTLSRVPKYWQNIDTSVLHNIHSGERLPARNIIELLTPVNKGSGSRIQSSYFINDTTILVCYRPNSIEAKEEKITVYDIWRLNNGKWKLLKGDLIDKQPDEDIRYAKQTFPFLGAYDPPQYADKWGVSVKISAPDSIVRQKSKTYNEIESDQDDYFVRNNPEFQLYVYKVNL